MAPKKQPNNLPSPTTNSSDSETDSQEHSTTSSGDSDSDSDSQPQQLTQPTPQQTPHQDSSSESESGSEESDSESDKIQKPPLSPEPKKPVSKPTQLKANGKRPAPIDQMVSKSKKSKGVEKVDKPSKSVDEKGSKGVDEKGSKSGVDEKGSKNVEKGGKGSKSVEKVDKASNKGKVSNGEQEGGDIEDKKPNLFARLFTEDDEIVLLQGMIDFKEKNDGADPSLNIVAFHDSVEDLLSCTVTKSQFGDKIRRLKKKYINLLKKGKDGEDPVISRPHEFKSFELSKKIWGSQGLGSEVHGDSKVKGSSRKKDDNAGGKTPLKSVGKVSELKEEVKSEVETEDWWSLYPLLCASIEAEASNNNFTGLMSPKEYVNKVVSGLNEEKARELEQEWKDLSVMEHQVYAKKLKVTSNQAEAAMNVIQH